MDKWFVEEDQIPLVRLTNIKFMVATYDDVVRFIIAYYLV